MKEKKGLKISIVLTLIGVAALVTGITFAIYENTINAGKSQVIKTGVVNFTLTESTNGLVLDNLQELTDYEGMAQETFYEFTIKNTGNTITDYEISLVDKPNSSYTGTILNEKYIKVGVLKNNSEEIIVNLKEVNRLIDKVTLDVDKSVNYKLRLWLDLKDITDEAKEALVGQKIFLVLKINGIQNVNTIESMDTSGANKPILASNMIPVYYDETKLENIKSENGEICGAVISKNGETETIECDSIILAIGHSARDTVEMLYNLGVEIIQKPFSVGARIEHPQSLINKAQYGKFAGHPKLGAADYKLACHGLHERGAYTFCMCPGGTVVAAASEKEGVIVNGMSSLARDGENANSALLVGIEQYCIIEIKAV